MAHTWPVIALVLALTSVSAGAPGAAAGPSTAAASAPVTGEGVGTPEGSSRAARAALDAGDLAAVRRFMHTTNDREAKVADALAKHGIAGAKLYQACVNAFGEEAARQGLVGVVPVRRQEIPAFTVEGDRARPVDTENEKFVGPAMIKVDGVWKQPIGEMIADQPPEAIEQQMAMVDVDVRTIEALAADVAAGKLKSVDDVKRAADERRQAAAAATVPAAPATSPAK